MADLDGGKMREMNFLICSDEATAAEWLRSTGIATDKGDSEGE